MTTACFCDFFVWLNVVCLFGWDDGWWFFWLPSTPKIIITPYIGKFWNLVILLSSLSYIKQNRSGSTYVRQSASSNQTRMRTLTNVGLSRNVSGNWFRFYFDSAQLIYLFTCHPPFQSFSLQSAVNAIDKNGQKKCGLCVIKQFYQSLTWRSRIHSNVKRFGEKPTH